MARIWGFKLANNMFPVHVASSFHIDVLEVDGSYLVVGRVAHVDIALVHPQNLQVGQQVGWRRFRRCSRARMYCWCHRMIRVTLVPKTMRLDSAWSC